MENMRTICVFYNEQEVYEALYVYEFFEWIGLVCHMQEANKPFNKWGNKFDIFVFIKDAKPHWWDKAGMEIDQLYYTRSELKNKEALIDLCKQIQQWNERRMDFLKEMVGIYDKYHLVSLLDRFTSSILIETMKIESRLYMCEQWKKALDELEALEKISEIKVGKEYYLYAIMYCQYKIERLSSLVGKVSRYDHTLKQIEHIETIYKYDSEFYNVELLIALTFGTDRRFRMYRPDCMEECIAKCNVNICKSRYMWNLFNYLDDDAMFSKINVVTQAHELDPNNYRVTFSIASIYMDIEKKLLAGELYKKITHQLGNQGLNSNMLLDDLWYLFKCNMILFNGSYKLGTNRDAQIPILLEIREWVNSIESNSKLFIALYSDWGEGKKDIAYAIRKLFERKALEDIVEHLGGKS